MNEKELSYNKEENNKFTKFRKREKMLIRK